jgi:hypothetical protein
MEVIEVKYNSLIGYNTILLNQSLFGRLVYRNYRGRKYATYVPGLLDSIKYYKPHRGVFYVTTEEFKKIDLNILSHLGSFLTRKIEASVVEEEFQTGKEVWALRAHEKGLFVRTQKKPKW